MCLSVTSTVREKEQTEGVLTGIHETSHHTYGSEEVHVLLG